MVAFKFSAAVDVSTMCVCKCKNCLLLPIIAVRSIRCCCFCCRGFGNKVRGIVSIRRHLPSTFPRWSYGVPLWIRLPRRSSRWRELRLRVRRQKVSHCFDSTKSLRMTYIGVFFFLWQPRTHLVHKCHAIQWFRFSVAKEERLRASRYDVIVF